MQSFNREEVKKAILENVEAVLDKASEKYDAVGEQASEYYKDAKEFVVDSRRDAVDHIKRNPERSVIIAAGVGALVGIIVSLLASNRRR